MGVIARRIIGDDGNSGYWVSWHVVFLLVATARFSEQAGGRKAVHCSHSVDELLFEIDLNNVQVCVDSLGRQYSGPSFRSNLGLLLLCFV